MGYADDKFYARPLQEIVGLPTGTLTWTASATGTTVSGVVIEQFTRRTQINSVKVYTVTAASANSAVGAFILLNGTNTVATGTVAAAGSYATLTNVANVLATVTQTITAANGGTSTTTITTTTTQSVFAAGSSPTLSIAGTATASAQAAGVYRIFAEVQERFDIGAGS